MSSNKTPLRRRVTPSVPFTLQVEDAGGEKFTIGFQLAFDMNAFALVEEEIGLSMLTDIGEIFDNPTVKTITALLWAGIQEHHSEFEGKNGLRAVRNLVTFGQAKAVLTACVEAFLTQLPKEQADRLRERKRKIEAGENLDPLVSAQVVTENPEPSN
jgi:hypothetical protein